MHVFNEEDKIQKFGSPEELIDYWYEHRRPIYAKRREYLLNKLKHEFDLINWKVKFILEFIAEELEIRNKKKSEIESMLVEKEYPKMGYKMDSEESYDYLLKMDLYKLTYEEVEKLKNERTEKETVYQTLLAKSELDLWTAELETLLTDINTEYTNWEKKIRESLGDEVKSSLKKKRTVTKSK